MFFGQYIVLYLSLESPSEFRQQSFPKQLRKLGWTWAGLNSMLISRAAELSVVRAVTKKQRIEVNIGEHIKSGLDATLTHAGWCGSVVWEHNSRFE